MNMLQPHRRNPSRRRKAPKRYEDEKFVSGAVDRYQHCYDNHYTGYVAGNKNYYTTGRGNKFCDIKWNDNNRFRLVLRDFPESLLEFTSIWRDMELVIPSEIIPVIASFLNIKDIDKQLIKDDDEFIAGDYSSDEEPQPKKWSCSGLPLEEEEEWNSEDETDDESDWSEYDD